MRSTFVTAPSLTAKTSLTFPSGPMVAFGSTSVVSRPWLR
jgi:hypothetical protein